MGAGTARTDSEVIFRNFSKTKRQIDEIEVKEAAAG